MSWMNVVQLLGGLGMLLYGIKAMGDGLEQAAGNKMKKLMEALTRNKLMCVLVGAIITAVIQSSTATTLMVVGFVNAGLLTLTRSIGVIMGANIGTTMTSLLLSVSLPFGTIFTAIGALCQLFGKKPKMKLMGQITMGLGLLFVGMDSMKAAMKPLTEWPGFAEMMKYAENPILGALVGAVITAILHSSAASVGILQAMRVANVVSMKASLYILFGQNIGTCVTALVSSSNANRTAKRTAVVHLLFNVIGTVLFVVLAWVLPLDKWIEAIAVKIGGDGSLALQIAIAHILFNVITTMILLPTSAILEKLACMIVPGEDAEEESMRLKYFDDRLFSTPPVAVQQLFKEVQRMSDLVMTNYRFALDTFFSHEEIQTDEFDNREEVIDYLNAEITQHLIDLKALSLNNKDNRLVGSLFHVVNDLERIGDHATNIVEISKERIATKTRFSSKAEHELQQLCEKVTAMLEKSIDIVKRQSTEADDIGIVETMEAEVDALSEALADHHVERVKEKKCTPKNGMMYLDMLNNLERIGDHADNLATGVEPDEINPAARMMW